MRAHRTEEMAVAIIVIWMKLLDLLTTQELRYGCAPTLLFYPDFKKLKVLMTFLRSKAEPGEKQVFSPGIPPSLVKSASHRPDCPAASGPCPGGGRHWAWCYPGDTGSGTRRACPDGAFGNSSQFISLSSESVVYEMIPIEPIP